MIILKVLLLFCALAAFCGAAKSTHVNAKLVRQAINNSMKWRLIGLVVWDAFLSIACLFAILEIIVWIF